MRILVVGEDALCCALGEKLVAAALPGWSMAGPSIDTKGVTKLIPALPRYVEQAQYVQPVLCIADTDGRCVKEWLQMHAPVRSHKNLLLRLAVNEAESWLLADQEGFAAGLHVEKRKLPRLPDEVLDAKSAVLQALAKSKQRQIRDEAVSRTNQARQGPGYNLHLCNFVKSSWSVERAKQSSPSLDRAFRHLQRMKDDIN
ncbi:hypothetical protein [Simplicispira lacusdiani]|uniref:hypothetical protein n=1 Tax=Simplicispira lacusdiani TaxID=2213010 RepID=UPI00130078DE|nr:hypothetical protein [Simplicispira lacusdiani]